MSSHGSEVDPSLLADLACPACKGPLVPASGVEALDCRTCKLRYPVRDGLPMLFAEAAEPIEPQPQ